MADDGDSGAGWVAEISEQLAELALYDRAGYREAVDLLETLLTKVRADRANVIISHDKA